MFDYNLLPEKYKKKTERWLIVHHLNTGLVLLNIALLALSFFVFSLFYSYDSLVSAGEALLSQLKQRPISAEQGQSFVQNLRSLKRIQTEHRFVLEALGEITALIPAAIKLDKFRVDYELNEVKLDGMATNRTVLQQMEENFAHADYTFAKIPMEVYTQEQNIPFSFSVTLKSQ